MSLREVLEEVLDGQDDAVRRVIYDVIIAEQQKIDMEKPHGILRDLHRAIDDQVRREEQGR